MLVMQTKMEAIRLDPSLAQVFKCSVIIRSRLLVADAVIMCPHLGAMVTEFVAVLVDFFVRTMVLI